MMIQKFVQAKHYTRYAMFQTQHWISLHWFKAVCLIGVVILLLKKDISFEVNLRSKPNKQMPTPPKQQNQVAPAPSPQPTPKVEENKDKSQSMINHAEASLAAVILPSKKPTATEGKAVLASLSNKAVADNAANTFANLAFILNPTFAAKKGIAPEIVEKHNAACRSYIKRFASVAQEEMRKHGIPASVKLAQGLLESDAGVSRLAVSNNNHFGIKCFSKACKVGHCSNFTDDTHKDFFRKYNNVWESYRAHSAFLQAERYQHLKKLGSKNYQGWAKGLKAAGYATDPRYAEKLIAIINALELHKYDR